MILRPGFIPQGSWRIAQEDEFSTSMRNFAKEIQYLPLFSLT